MKFILSVIGTLFLSTCAGAGLHQIMSRFVTWDGEPAICILATMFFAAALMVFVVDE